MRDAIDDGLSDRLFGPQRFNTTSTNNGNNDGYASFIFIEDAVIEQPLGEEIRDGVGIDRQWGTAADKIKFDRAILPRGTSFDLELTVELPPADSQWDLLEEEVLDGLGALMAALRDGELYLGAAKTRGLGRVRSKGEPKVTAVNLLTPKGILDCLRGTGDKKKLPDTPRPRPQLIFEIDWQPQGPVMVKAEPDGLAVNILPLTSAIGKELALVLPGSSVKGAIRFQAERILRTLGIAAPEADPETGFLELVELPLVTTVFGTSKTANGKTNKVSDKPLPGLGALLINDCYSRQTISNKSWQAIASATKDKELREALNAAGLEKTQQGYHVAIDRWKGSAAETMLYSGLEPFGIQWEKLRFILNLNRIPEEEVLVAIAFILIIIRDLSNNRIPLGYGVNRGYGSIVINNVLIKAQGVKNLSMFERDINLEKGDITQLDSSVLSLLDEAWKNWLVSSRKL